MGDGRFEWDDAKSQANRLKHGIGFEEAIALWDDPLGHEARLVYPDEPRWSRTGRFDGRLWSAIYTMRGDRIRLISVRRARESEERSYGA